MPIIQGYEDAGDFTVTERLKTSVRANLFFHLCVGSIALCGLILLIILGTNWFVYQSSVLSLVFPMVLDSNIEVCKLFFPMKLLYENIVFLSIKGKKKSS